MLPIFFFPAENNHKEVKFNAPVSLYFPALDNEVQNFQQDVMVSQNDMSQQNSL
jgi:hypothetical protein